MLLVPPNDGRPYRVGKQWRRLSSPLHGGLSCQAQAPQRDDGSGGNVTAHNKLLSGLGCTDTSLAALVVLTRPEQRLRGHGRQTRMLGTWDGAQVHAARRCRTIPLRACPSQACRVSMCCAGCCGCGRLTLGLSLGTWREPCAVQVGVWRTQHGMLNGAVRPGGG